VVPLGDGFDSADTDAQLWVRAAWGTKGVYLLVECLDDSYLDPPLCRHCGECRWNDPDFYKFDAVELCFDIMNSEEQKSHFVCDSTQQTLSYVKLQCPFGGYTPAHVCGVNRPDSSRLAYCPDSLLSYRPLAIEAVKDSSGVSIEILHFGQRRIQEWLVPWEKIGAGVEPIQTPGDRKIAFQVSYSDRDVDFYDSLYSDCLFFRNKGNELSHDTLPTWGDMTFAPWPFGGSVSPTDSCSPYYRTPVRGAPRGKIKYSNLSDEEYFTLNGRKIPASRGKCGPNFPRILICRRPHGGSGSTTYILR
jgi:hypothetical protein